MLLGDLQLDRNLVKQPQQSASTDDAAFVSANPANTPRNIVSTNSNTGTGVDSQKSGLIITGSVITACIIQTSALPSRVELQGNNLTFFDDTFVQNGVVKGDTSRLVFTHDLDQSQGYIIEKRASVYNTYDNVLSWYATPAANGAHNYMFIGRNATVGDQERNVNSMHFAINSISSEAITPTNAYLNGVLDVEYSIDGVLPAANYKPLFLGDSRQLGPGLSGFSALLIGGAGGYSGLGYVFSTGFNVMLYITNATTITVGASMVPDTTAVYNLGSPTKKFATIYGSVVACPLPTVPDALAVIERIPAPVPDVGDRGHYGRWRPYFDDATFPEELLHITREGNQEIEHSNMLGFLLKAVIELNEKVKGLEAQLNK